jgi:hypothetical protein
MRFLLSCCEVQYTASEINSVILSIVFVSGAQLSFTKQVRSCDQHDCRSACPESRISTDPQRSWLWYVSNAVFEHPVGTASTGPPFYHGVTRTSNW